MERHIRKHGSPQVDDPGPSKSSPFRRKGLREFPDIALYSANLLEIYKQFGADGGLDYKSGASNSIELKGSFDIEALRRTTVHFSGKNNRMSLEGLRNVHKLDIACIGGSQVSIGSPHTIRGLIVMSSSGSNVEIGSGCLISRDVVVYASKAHGLYSSIDGVRRFKHGVKIDRRVWLGQGSRILTGATIGEGSVIGAYSVLAGKIANNCAAAGNPCRVTSKDVFWTGRAVVGDGNYFEFLQKAKRPVPEFVKRTQD